MAKYNLYVVVSADRHRDDIFTLFKKEEDAIKFAKKEFRSLIGRFKDLTKEDWEEFDKLIEYRKSADYIDGDYSVRICETSYPV